jgi:hypothetical protein
MKRMVFMRSETGPAGLCGNRRIRSWADKALMNRKELWDESALSVENVVEDQGLA